LSQKTLDKILENIGLTEKESEVYMFLAKNGVREAKEISGTMKMHRAQVYRILGNLQNMGIVEQTLEHPTRFAAVSLEKLMDQLIRSRREQVEQLEDEKDELAAYWRSIQTETTPHLEKFLVTSGSINIYSRISELIATAEKEISVLTTSLGMTRSVKARVDETVFNKVQENKNVRLRLLTRVSTDNIEALKQNLEKISNLSLQNIEGRHTNLQLFPRFIIKDDEEAVLFLTPREDYLPSEDVSLWTNSKVFTQALKAFFDELWKNGTDIPAKIHEIETGEPITETTIIRDSQETHRKIKELTLSAKEEIMVMLSPKGILRALKYDPYPELSRRGVKIRIMSPINRDNFEAAQKLQKYCQIKHIDSAYMRIIIIDRKHLFQVRNPPPDVETTNPETNFENALYTNDQGYVKRMYEMLNDLWNRAPSVTKMKLEDHETASQS
jgi:sugar-specific transcriptional regulator TrmB